jgi:hypothetical protein
MDTVLATALCISQRGPALDLVAMHMLTPCNCKDQQATLHWRRKLLACLLVLYTRVSAKKLAIQMIARNESRNREVLRRLLKRMGAGQAGTCRGEHGTSRCRTPPVQGGALIMSKADRDEKWAYDPGELKRGSPMALFKLRSKRPPYKTVQKGKSSRSSHCNAGGWRGRGVINMDGHCQWQRQAHQPGRHSQSSGNSAAGCSKHKYRTSAGQCC